MRSGVGVERAFLVIGAVSGLVLGWAALALAAATA